MKEHRKLIHVHPEFHRQLKIEAAETGKHMEDITKEIAEEFKIKRAGKIKNGFGFI